MTDMSRVHLLIDKHLDALAAPAEMAELGELLAADSDAADAFARATRTDNALDEHFADRRTNRFAQLMVIGLAENGAPARDAGRAGGSFLPYLPWAAAAVLVVVTGGGLAYLLHGRHERTLIVEPQVYQVVAGRVLVNGVENETIAEWAEVEVIGERAALIRLADGSLAELVPGSKAVLRSGRRPGRQVVELAEGSGGFQVEQPDGHFCVETPVGKVTALGTEFEVELLRPGREEARAEGDGPPMALVVAAVAGNVGVHYGNHDYELGSGEDRVYAGARRGPEVARLGGKVVAVTADGRAITLELPPVGKKAPERRTVQLDDQSKLSYVNVPLKGQRPTVGYSAKVWLAPGSNDLATAVTFNGNKAEVSKPNLAGRVTAVSVDGKEMTVQMPPGKKGEPAKTLTVKIGDRTKVSYATAPTDGQRPTAGYMATVWLAKGSPELAAAVTFSTKKGSAPAPDLMGRVTAVSADGHEITLELPPARKGGAGRTATVTVRQTTKVAFKGIEKDRARPTPGFTAAVWLEKGSRDMAAVIRFAERPSGGKATGKPAKEPRPTPTQKAGLDKVERVARLARVRASV